MSRAISVVSASLIWEDIGENRGAVGRLREIP